MGPEMNDESRRGGLELLGGEGIIGLITKVNDITSSSPFFPSPAPRVFVLPGRGLASSQGHGREQPAEFVVLRGGSRASAGDAAPG